jgi:hypothetical protein
MYEFDYDYLSSPEFLQAMADAGYAIPGSEQVYAPPAEAAYYAPEQTYIAPPAAAYYAPEQAYTPPAEAAYYAPAEAAYYAPAEDNYYSPPAEAAYYAPPAEAAPAEAAYYAPPAEAAPAEAAPVAGIGSPAVAAAAPAAAPNYLSNAGLSDDALASLYALSAGNAGGETGAGIGGLPSIGNIGANYVDTTGMQLITAPISNKGNPTAYGANNQFYMQPNELVRVVDRSTNTVIFEGKGIDAAKKAVEIGQNLTDTMGRKADYQIQTGLTPDRYAPVANEKFNKTDLQNIASVAGTVLPLALMAIPGAGPALFGMTSGAFAASIPAQIAFGALTGAASAGLKGDDILKGAVLGGASGAGGALLPKIPAVGDLGNLAKPIGVGVGSTVGGLVTGQNIQDSLISGIASGALAYAAPSIQEGIKGIGQGSNVNAGSGGGGGGGGSAGTIVTATPATGGVNVSVGGGGSNSLKQPAITSEAEAPAATVTASPAVNAPVINGIGGGGGTAATDTTPRAVDDATTTEAEPPATTVNASSAVPGAVVTAISGVVDGDAPLLNKFTDLAKADDTTPANEEPPATTVTATPATPGVSIAGGGSNITPVDIPPSTVAADTKAEDTTTTEEEPPRTIVEATPATAGVTVPVAGIGGGGGTTATATDAILENATKAEDTTTTEEEPPRTIVEATPATAGVTVPVAGIGGGGGTTATVTDTTPAADDTKADDTAAEEKDPPRTIVTGGGTIPGTNITVGGGGSVVDTLDPINLKSDPALTEKTTLEKIKDAAQLVSTASTLVPLVTGAVGGGGGGGTLPRDNTRLNFVKSTLRPTLTGGIGGTGGGGAGGTGGTGSRYPYTPTTYGRAGGDQETEYLFFTRDPVTGEELTDAEYLDAADGSPIAPGKKEGGEIEDDMVKHLVDYHKNGGHQGPGQVKGIGSGQEDKIPAWLSDGEYVWSAQDVADLGDGSTDEGVRRLDKMREMVRRQAGRKDVKKIAKPQKGIDRMLKAVGGMV